MGLMSRTPTGSAVMSNGLIITPRVMGAQVTSMQLFFEPSSAIIAKKLNTLGMSLKDFRTPLRRAIQQVVIPSIQMNFHKHGRPRWAALDPKTVLQKGGSYAPLVRTGALQSGMKSIDLWTIGRKTAFIADLPSSIWYGKVQQAGYGGHDVQEQYEYGQNSQGRPDDQPTLVGLANFGEAGSIPPRPFVMIQPSDEPLIELVFDIWLEEQIIKAGFR